MEPDQTPHPTAPPSLQQRHHHPLHHAPQTRLVVAPAQYAHATPTSAVPPEGHAEEWHWCGAGRGGSGGAHCSISCGREGLVLTYNAQAGAPQPSPCPQCSLAVPPTAVAPSSTHSAPAEPSEGTASHVLSRSLLDLSRPQQQHEESVGAGRSLTFSGSLDRRTPRQQQQQRQYGRRCKSTAHIVLQNNDVTGTAPRPHEFHAITTAATPTTATFVPPTAARGRARHRTAPQPSSHGGAEGGGWHRMEAGGRGLGAATTTTTCCSCHHHHHHHHHCPTLCPLLANHDPCHPCLHPYAHHPCPHHHLTTPTPSLLPPYCHPHAATPCPAPPEGTVRAASRSPTVRTFNSHRHYEDEASPPPSPRLAVRRRTSTSPQGSPSPERRGAEDVPSQGAPQLPRRVPRMGAAAAAAAAAATTSSAAAPPPTQEEREHEASGSRHRPQRPRPRTIHIDVYCSSSDDQDSSSPTSEDTRGSVARRPHAVVALGSKQREKTELSLGRHHHHHHHHNHHPLEQRTSSFVYSRPSPEATPAAPRSTFITDDDLPLCASPTELRPSAAPASPPLTPTHSRRPSDRRRSPIPMPAPPQRPTTLAVPTCSVAPVEEGGGEARRSHHSSLSYLSSPLEGDPWEGELWEPEQDLSWRGSEFEVSTPRLTSDVELAAVRAASEVSLGSLHEAGGEGSPRMWRSPHLERQRYMQRDQEDRYREVLLRRAQQLRQQQGGETGQQQQQQRSLSGTPTSVAQLAQLSAFKDYSREDLQVISKSLERRESQQSLGKEGPFSLPQQREFFRPVVEKDANRLLEWMQQYKAQERRASAVVAQGTRDSLRPGGAKPDYLGGVDRKESYCSVGRRRSFPGSSGSWRGGAAGGVRRGSSLRCLELREAMAPPTTQRTAPTPTRPLEKKNSFKFQDKQQFFRSLERRDSGTVADASLERQGSGRLERRGSGRLVGTAVRDGAPQGTHGDGDHLKRTASLGRGDKIEDAATMETGEPKMGRRRPSSGLLERLLEREEEHRLASAECQDTVATMRRRLSAAARNGSEAPKSPGAPQSPLTSRRRHRASPPHTEEMGGRHITVGAFRHLARFPFSQTVPVPASRALSAARTACEPQQRKFVRPQLFGEMTSSYPSRRGIHYGPPRNPQCSCRNCRAWSDQPPEDCTAPASRLRTWSLTDLGSGTAEHPSPPLRPATALSRTSSNVSDHASSRSHVGSAAAGREQS